LNQGDTTKAGRILVIDVGGTHIKLLATGRSGERRIPSGPAMTPDKMVQNVKNITKKWK